MPKALKRLKNLNRDLLDAAVGEFASTLAAGATVIDIGAGSGHYRRCFPGQHYLAVDRGLETGALDGLDVASDILQLPLADRSCDAAICIEVIEHVYETGPFLAEIGRVLKDGGRLLLTSPLCYGEHMQPYDFHRYTRHALQRLFDASGLRVESLRPRGGYFMLMAYLAGRLPDELIRGMGPRWTKQFVRPVARLTFTYLLAPLLMWLDRFDRHQRFTLGYTCLLSREGERGLRSTMQP